MRTITARMLSAGAVIDRLGGTGVVSAELGLRPSIVSGWRTRGLPPGRWPEIVGLAAKLECNEITFEVLAAIPAPAEPAEARA